MTQERARITQVTRIRTRDDAIRDLLARSLDYYTLVHYLHCHWLGP